MHVVLQLVIDPGGITARVVKVDEVIASAPA